MEASKLGILVWLFVAMYAAFAGVALFKILPQLSRGNGLLISKPGQRVEPERVQALIFSMATISLLGFWGGQEIAANSATLPDIPAELLAAFGGSQAIYVGGKFLRWKGYVK